MPWISRIAGPVAGHAERAPVAVDGAVRRSASSSSPTERSRTARTGRRRGSSTMCSPPVPPGRGSRRPKALPPQRRTAFPSVISVRFRLR